MPTDVLSRLTAVIHETFGDDSVEITRETIAEDVPGWDSLSHTILMLSIEDAFGVSIPAGSRAFANVGELVDSIERLCRP